MSNIDYFNDNKPIESYIAYIRDTKSRFNSTSGGIFFELGRNCILEGGSVYGVAFDDKFSPQHRRVTNYEDLKLLQGSKYPQSNVGDIFVQVKKDLDEGKKVLFSGTPCQIVGLKAYLRKSYTNLVAVDLICHGVPSPGIWNKYLNYNFKIDEIIDIKFKDKSNGWKLWRVRIESKNALYEKERTDDAYMASYINAWNIRPSCYKCKFKGLDGRNSDITIADAWGKAETDLSLNDNKGLSCIIINTEHGECELEKIKRQLVHKKYSFEDIVSGNPAYNESIKKHFLRKCLTKITYKNIKLIDILSNDNLFGKLISKINRVINRSN